MTRSGRGKEKKPEWGYPVSPSSLSGKGEESQVPSVAAQVSKNSRAGSINLRPSVHGGKSFVFQQKAPPRAGHNVTNVENKRGELLRKKNQRNVRSSPGRNCRAGPRPSWNRFTEKGGETPQGQGVGRPHGDGIKKKTRNSPSHQGWGDVGGRKKS